MASKHAAGWPYFLFHLEMLVYMCKKELQFLEYMMINTGKQRVNINLADYFLRNTKYAIKVFFI